MSAGLREGLRRKRGSMGQTKTGSFNSKVYQTLLKRRQRPYCLHISI